MIIFDSKIICDIQVEFYWIFLGLKIEFYKQVYEFGQGLLVKEWIDVDLKFKFVWEVYNKEDFEIDLFMIVVFFEQFMVDCFGFNVQVFCKFGNLWM